MGDGHETVNARDSALVWEIALEVGLLRRYPDGSKALSGDFVDAMLSNVDRGMAALASIEEAMDMLYPQLGQDERLLAINLVINVVERADPPLYDRVMDEIKSRSDIRPGRADTARRMIGDARARRGMR